MCHLRKAIYAAHCIVHTFTLNIVINMNILYGTNCFTNVYG